MSWRVESKGIHSITCDHPTKLGRREHQTHFLFCMLTWTQKHLTMIIQYGNVWEHEHIGLYVAFIISEDKHMFRMFRLDPSSGVPSYMQIKEQIKTQIAMGHLTPGEKLPNIRQLAKDLIVNPTTIVRAYRELEFEELIVGKQSSGVFVTDHGLALTDQAKEERVRDLFMRGIVEAVNLKISSPKMLTIFADILDEMETGRRKGTDEMAPLDEMVPLDEHLPEEGR